MIVKGLNFDIQWKNKSKNFELIEKQLQNEEADLFILPEMFSTGFSMEPNEIADRNDEALTFLKNISTQKNAAFCGSVSIEEKGNFYNRMYFVEPNSNVQKYDKRHLFSFSGEDKVYKKGDERVIVNYKGVRFLLQICYDLRFPVFSRNINDYDAIIYVANWPEKRVFAWEHLLQARAIENLAYVFGINRIGVDGNELNYLPSSHFFFADGSEISKLNGNVLSAEINLEELKKFRQHFSFLNDRDDFRIEF